MNIATELEKISDMKIGLLVAGIVIFSIVVGVSSDESQATINARSGLEQCIIQDGSKDRGELRPKTIWVKDCSVTLKAMKGNK